MQPCGELVGSITKSALGCLTRRPVLSTSTVDPRQRLPHGKCPRILRVQSSKLRLEGSFDFIALSKATPGYVGADLASLTGAAGIVAVKRIFRELSAGSIVLPEVDTDTFDLGSTTLMTIDAPPDSTPKPTSPCPFSSYRGPSTPLASSIVHFLRAHPNPLTEAQLSPLNIQYSDFIEALKHVQPSSKREGFATIPDVSWGDIGALYHIREELQMAIVQPIRRPELFRAVGIDAGCGVLLWGPPGCGKTLLAKAVANESRANFISVKGPELLNKAGPTNHVDFNYRRRLIIAYRLHTIVCWRKRTRRTPIVLSCSSVCPVRYFL
jgi:ribosome biogenesis ATPase